MGASPIAVANAILELAKRENRGLTPLQVMKLVYMSHGWHLATAEAPLINEPVQAWQYGPVIPSLYQAMKSFGSRAIDPPHLRGGIFGSRALTPEQQSTVEIVFRAYGQYPGIALSNLSHRKGSPWSRVWRPGIANLVINDELIRQHYKDVRTNRVLDAA